MTTVVCGKEQCLLSVYIDWLASQRDKHEEWCIKLTKLVDNPARCCEI
jgi:hypothetical protein